MQTGADGVTGPVAVACKHNLAFETRGAVGANIELPLGRRVTEGRGNSNDIFAARLTPRNVPRKPNNAVDDLRTAGRDGVSVGSFDFKTGGSRIRHRSMPVCM